MSSETRHAMANIIRGVTGYYIPYTPRVYSRNNPCDTPICNIEQAISSHGVFCNFDSPRGESVKCDGHAVHSHNNTILIRADCNITITEAWNWIHCWYTPWPSDTRGCVLFVLFGKCAPVYFCLPYHMIGSVHLLHTSRLYNRAHVLLTVISHMQCQ